MPDGGKCYEIRLVDCPGPLAQGQKLWERVVTPQKKTDEWGTVARRLLAANKLVACRTCGCRPGTEWIEGTQDFVCGDHVNRS